MAYYFMVESKKGEYQPLNISKSKFFQVTPKFNKPCAYTLQEIDMFTMMFNDEQELRNTLVLEEILPVSLSTRQLSSRSLLKGKYNKVPHDFLYQKDIEFIADPTRVVDLIMKRYHQDDFLFIKKLANNFSSFYECSSTAPEVRQLAEKSIREGHRSHHLDEVDKNGDKLVARLVKLLILEHYEKSTGEIEYKDKVNYRNLHAIIAFINNYDKESNKKEETQTTSFKPETAKLKKQTSSEETPKANSQSTLKSTIHVKTRSKKKKNYNIEGQISLFD